MPPLAFEEPKGGPLAMDAPDEEPPREPGRDVLLVVLKAATVAFALALVGVVILATTSGGDEPAAKPPPVPEIPASNAPSTGQTTTPPLGGIVVPEVRSQTTAITPSLPPPPPVTEPTLPAPEPPGRPEDRFVSVGEPCDTPGAYAFTESFEAVMCDGRGQNGRLTWRPIFR
jgi:hypothetical protein